MSDAYTNIKNTTSLRDILTYLKTIDDPSDIIVFFDWDDTLVNPDYDNIIEPEVTKELFDYMIKNKIYFSIITGRFYNTACDETHRNIYDMKHNIINTMHPSLRNLGINTDKYSSPLYQNEIYRVYNEKYDCVGILYMGIFFSGKKGETIKNYLRQTGMNKKHIIFVDDYEPYLMETTANVPTIKAYRRKTPYIPLTL